MRAAYLYSCSSASGKSEIFPASSLSAPRLVGVNFALKY